MFVFGEQAPYTYEERLTLWRATDFAAAVRLTESEAHDYADSLPGCTPAGLVQAYQLTDSPGHGAEVFSLMRDSALPTTEYLSTIFDTGRERQGSQPTD